jgi:hypothetical protein
MLESLAQEMDGGALAVWWVLALAFWVVYIIAGWKVFEKAGQAGWKVIIPIYNIYIMLKIVGRPGWWLILFLIPLVNIVVWIILLVDMSKSYGHGVGFALGLIFLGWIFWLILGFGESRYLGPSAPGAAPMQPPAPPAPPAPATGS